MTNPSPLEQRLAHAIQAAGLPTPEREHRFHETRQWRMDFAWPEAQVALEVEGGIWVRGRHARPKGFAEDCCKLNEAALAGWTVLRVTGEHIASGQAVEWLRRALARFYGEQQQEAA
jgi:very-short-patch-repair endonuclease